MRHVCCLRSTFLLFMTSPFLEKGIRATSILRNSVYLSEISQVISFRDSRIFRTTYIIYILFIRVSNGQK